MKKLFIVPILLLLSCSTTGRKLSQKSDIGSKQMFTVLKLDSIENVYVIYAKENGSWFKILSKKEHLENCDPIEIGKEYPLSIKSLFPKNFQGKHDLSPDAMMLVTGTYFNGTPVQIERDSITDLHIAENIKGLCFIKDK